MGEDEPRREAYHLQRMADGDTTTVAVFYSTKEGADGHAQPGRALPAGVGRQADLAQLEHDAETCEAVFGRHHALSL